jgi:hypothetical protein
MGGRRLSYPAATWLRRPPFRIRPPESDGLHGANPAELHDLGSCPAAASNYAAGMAFCPSA